MKKILGLFLIGILSSTVVMAGTPVETLVPIDGVFAPRGFDSNDNTEVVVSGYLPNLCHASPMAKATVRSSKIDIQVSALKYDPTNPFCPEVIVPFVKPVQVGLLDKGTYGIVVNGKTIYEKKANIFINESTSNSVDEHVYANVEYVEKTEGTRTVKLKGYNPSDCFVLDAITVVDNGLDTFSVLPKMKQVSEFCPMKMVPFTYEFDVPKTLKAEKVLLHVRIMDGRSVNALFDNK